MLVTLRSCPAATTSRHVSIADDCATSWHTCHSVAFIKVHSERIRATGNGRLRPVAQELRQRWTGRRPRVRVMPALQAACPQVLERIGFTECLFNIARTSAVCPMPMFRMLHATLSIAGLRDSDTHPASIFPSSGLHDVHQVKL